MWAALLGFVSLKSRFQGVKSPFTSNMVVMHVHTYESPASVGIAEQMVGFTWIIMCFTSEKSCSTFL